MKNKNLFLSILITFILTLTACEATPNLSQIESLSTDASPTRTHLPLIHISTPQFDTESDKEEKFMPTKSEDSGFVEPGLEALVDLAKEDLAQRLSIQEEDLVVQEAKSVIWPDASVGCPQPGMAYRQVPEDGALILLNAQGIVYEYHSGGNRGLFLCEKNIVKDPSKPPILDINALTPPSADTLYPPISTPDNSIPPGEDQ